MLQVWQGGYLATALGLGSECGGWLVCPSWGVGAVGCRWVLHNQVPGELGAGGRGFSVVHVEPLAARKHGGMGGFILGSR